ncbi:MAG TPA: PVC-type heme-binding CxxCH protein [Gemmataceae bacterium]|nr:PVC-type heme-binding CxxCH protein [Gemmataceae bacterium]
MMTRRLPALLAALLLTAGLAPAQTLSPEEAVKRMKVADGFEVKIVAAEPMVRQPVSISFDDRGRVWVVQYLQYPAPAGLKPVKVDQYLRTVYDRVPEPPPKGPRGADRITILSDFDRDGRAHKSKDFVTGLNLCSGTCLGHGGVYVLQVPYLLFYPDRDGDDAPDGDPEVLLKGFGMEDAHAVANSLQWGPDGWLYGAQGSTVTANIRGIEFQQGIWRFHPITKEFELFSEGGGNTWGLDFDAHGNVIAGTNWGGSAMLHQVQGGYYIKGFAKHGALHNPHTYGYFDHVPYKDFRGGHVTIGGIVYHGGAYPAKYEGQYVAGNLLTNALHWHTLDRRGSSFTSHFAGDFLVANDPRFRPVDCLTGPDGAVYVADWYDIRANHVDPVDNWDKTTGRIYKIVASGGRKPPGEGEQPGGLRPPLAKRSSQELVELLGHPNDWYSREARRILAERRDSAVVPGLKKTILAEKGQLALESLWALYVSGGLDEAFAEKLFDHPSEDVRAWTVRLLCDPKKVSSPVAARLVELAKGESSPTVRSQLACSAKRLPGKDCLPIVGELLRHKEDVSDPHIPLLLWWAVEDKAIGDRELVLGLLDSPEAWKVPLIRQSLVERLGRRYMAEGGEADFATCARLLAAAPGPDEVKLLVQGMEKALEGRQLPKVPAVLEKQLSDLWDKQSASPLLVRFALRLGSPPGYERALAIAADAKAPDADRSNLIEVLGQSAKPECVPVLLSVLAEAKADGVRGAALSALQPFAEERVTRAVLDAYPSLSAGLRGKAQTLLCGRPASALAFLQAVDAGKIAPKEVPLDPLRRVAGYKDQRLTKLIEKHWGKVGPLPAGEKVARINAIRHSLGQRPGDAVNGKLLFTKTCATCHTLFGEGNKVGPELTGADRKNRDFLLLSLVDPSAYIRPEFVAHVVNLKDGRTLTGLVAESSPKAITLLNDKNERTVIAREKIDDMSASAVSLMPEKILDPLSEQEIRDLFAYLQADGPAK